MADELYLMEAKTGFDVCFETVGIAISGGEIRCRDLRDWKCCLGDGLSVSDFLNGF